MRMLVEGHGIRNVVKTVLLLASVVCSHAAFAGSPIVLPNGFSANADTKVGKGSGVIAVKDGIISLEASASELGKYQENWRMDAAVFDFYLKEPVALSKDCARLGWNYNISYKKGSPRCILRVLVKGSDGRVRSWGTRFGGRNSNIETTKSFEPMESYGWNASETGRFDPWIMTGLDTSADVSYEPPAMPLTLLGFRLVLLGTGDISVLEIKDIHEIGASQSPQPYWTINYDKPLMQHIGKRGIRFSSIPVRYGWAPERPGVFLTAADLKLQSGEYDLGWEILDRQGWEVLRSGRRAIKPRDDDRIALPLMPTGSYLLRFYVRGGGKAEGEEWYFLYTVIRNASGESFAVEDTSPKPLVFGALNHKGNVYGPDKPVKLRISCASDADTDLKDASIEWLVESADGRELARGNASSGKGAELDLTQVARSEKALWISAKLTYDGKVIDMGRRVIGVRTPSVGKNPDEAAKTYRLEAMKGKIPRTRGDWHEGSTPVVSRLNEELELFRGWISEAKAVGYNTVELSATWGELEPLPGVYLFDYLEKYIAVARENGLYVILRVHPSPGNVPSFLPREFQESTDGLAHGLWSGSSNEVFSPGSKAIADAYIAYLERLAAYFQKDATVLGYTISHLFFDHAYFSSPWLGQYVDYSEAMRQNFIRFLRSKYDNDIASLRKSHARDYATWESVTLPRPDVRMDDYGRLKPRTDALWDDWTQCKVSAMTGPWRLDAAAALRRGDPGCAVGPYSDQARCFLETEYAKIGVFVPQGSMEAQFPPPSFGYPVRYEPHAKVAKHPIVADVGMTNLLFHDPGFNGFFNYWQDNWRLDNVPEGVRQAEERLKQWFAVIDCLAGAVPVEGKKGEALGLEINSLETMLYNWQHIFSPRIEDYVKPFEYQAKIERLRCEKIYSKAMTAETLAKSAYVYLPYSADTLKEDQAEMIEAYVKNGGTLVMEATSGFWQVGLDRANVLAGRLGLPEARPVTETTPSSEQGDSEKIAAAPGSILAGLPLGFRVREFHPPTDDQPAPWIHNALKYYFKRFRLASALPRDAQVLATFKDGAPAVYRLQVGHGQVLFFSGVIDWLNCPGLASRVDNWAKDRKLDAPLPEPPEILASEFKKGENLYILGRRFVGQADLQHLKEGKTPEQLKEATTQTIRWTHAGKGSYNVRELVSGRDFGVLTSDELSGKGVSLELRRGEGFLLEAAPAGGAK